VTDHQSIKFDEKGCVARCLIKLTNSEATRINKREFCAKFEGYFVDKDENYGNLTNERVAVVTTILKPL